MFLKRQFVKNKKPTTQQGGYPGRTYPEVENQQTSLWGRQMPWLQWRNSCTFGGILASSRCSQGWIKSQSLLLHPGMNNIHWIFVPKVTDLSVRNQKSSNYLFWGSTMQMAFHSPLAASANLLLLRIPLREYELLHCSSDIATTTSMFRGKEKSLRCCLGSYYKLL